MSHENLIQPKRQNLPEAEFGLQFRLPIQDYQEENQNESLANVEDTLRQLLAKDLSFEREKTSYATHNLHAFAAKFPPQIPRLFIQKLTTPGELVLDPMVGSGTTVVEALLANRKSIGVDLDPLAVLLAYTKTAKIDLFEFFNIGKLVLEEAKRSWSLSEIPNLSQNYSIKAIAFFEYWFESSHHQRTLCISSVHSTC